MSDDSMLMRDAATIGKVSWDQFLHLKKNVGSGGLLEALRCTLMWSLQKSQLILQELGQSFITVQWG